MLLYNTRKGIFHHFKKKKKKKRIKKKEKQKKWIKLELRVNP